MDLPLWVWSNWLDPHCILGGRCRACSDVQQRLITCAVPSQLPHPPHSSQVVAFLESAKAEGATVLTGGGPPPGRDKGFYVMPTVLTDVEPHMKVSVCRSCFRFETSFDRSVPGVKVSGCRLRFRYKPHLTSQCLIGSRPGVLPA